jgi:RND family efflux transporter MFP subunit
MLFRGVLFAWVAAAVLACGDPEASVEGRESAIVASGPLEVETFAAELGSLSVVVSASGSIEARRMAQIGPEVAGRIVHVAVDVGDEVEAGDLLFEIDPVPYELALAEARAGLSLARAQSKNAAADAERLRKLAAERAASRQDVDQVKTQAEVAHARVAQADARLARAERDLASTTVRAPWAGSVVERRAHEGTLAGDGPIVVLQESGALEAVLTIPEASPVTVRIGDPVSLRVDGLRAPIETRVDRVSDRVDPQTRTYEVRAPVEAAAQLKAGSFARARLQPSASGELPTFERSALLMRDGRSFVFRVSETPDGLSAERVAVRVGASTADRVQILSGVEAGDELVRGPVVRRLTDGARIARAAKEVATP